MTEVFIQVDGFPNYSISNLGRLVNNTTGKFIKQHLNNYGYPLVSLCGKYTKSVHRLVAIHFVPNNGVGVEVNHKNGVKTDNNADNLEWVTRHENMQHAYREGLQKGTWKGVYGNDHCAAKKVAQIDKDGNIVRVWMSRKEAEKEGGFNNFSVSKCSTGKLPHYKGFTWKNVV